MQLQDSMCEVIRRVKSGEDEAVREIWDRYFPKLVRLAGRRLSDHRKRMAD